MAKTNAFQSQTKMNELDDDDDDDNNNKASVTQGRA